jgi:hypothetical protein
MNEIDQLTLKLLTSKKRYNSYLANANPEKSSEIQEYNQKVQKYVPRIKKLIGKYLENPETQTSNEIDDMLESCFKTLIKHFEMQDYEDKCAKHGYDATDSSEEEEMMFQACDQEACDQEACDQEACDNEDLDQEASDNEGDNEDNNEPPVKPKSNSYWGKNISKSSTLDHFIKGNRRS